MTIQGIVLYLVGQLVTRLLDIPIAILNIIGLMLPNCTDMGFVALPAEALQNFTQLVRWLFPLWSLLPISQLFAMASITIVYFGIKFFAKPIAKGVVMNFTHLWWIVLVVWILAASLNFFLGSSWQDSPIWMEWFGTSVTSTAPFEGGGGGGGGGGSW